MHATIGELVGPDRLHKTVVEAHDAYAGVYHDAVDNAQPWRRLPAVNMPMRGGKYPWRTPLARPRIGSLSTGKAPL